MQTIADGKMLAHAMVDTVRDALLVLDGKLNVVAASRSFYSTFLTTADVTIGRRIYDLGHGEWNNEPLKLLLERIIPDHGVMDHFELDQTFTHLGKRSMLLNARKIFYENDANSTLLLAIEDITERKNAERLLKNLSDQKDNLMSEMSHRVANSLQIIASILLLKARSVQSEETRGHLEDAHRRVMSVADLQHQLIATSKGEKLDVGTYLKKLCETLAASMIRDRRAIELHVVSETYAVTSEQAVSIGLIVTELIINALKLAFPIDAKAGRIDVAYAVEDSGWTLSIADNGSGMAEIPADRPVGLGTSIIKALAQQLEAVVEVVTSRKGTTVSIKNHHHI
jgi:PAS domain S-box-containing protein